MHDFLDAARQRLSGRRLAPAREAEIAEELAQHMEDRCAELVRRGVPAADAAALVVQELNADGEGDWSRGLLDERAPDFAIGGGGAGDGWLRGIAADVTFAVRLLRRNVVFTAAALTALGLGTGAATAVFSLLNGVVLTPLPYAAPERLVSLTETKVVDGLRDQPVSPVTFLDYRASGVFEDAAAWWVPQTNLADEFGEPIRVPAVETSENLFDVLGVAPQRGRVFDRDSTLHGEETQVVISDRLWRGRFGARDDVIGATVRLNGFPHEIIGVMPAGFDFPDGTDVWQRLRWDLSQHNRGARFMGSVARLADGVTVLQANAALAETGARVAAEYARTNADWSAEAEPLAADVAGVFGPALFALLAAAGLLLLIGCINVANLLLARAAAREAELAVRGALGASRLRLARQLLVESVLLAGAGTLIGLLIATAAVRGFIAWSPIDVPRAADVAVNLRVLAFAGIVCLTTSVIFGLVPALRASRADLLGVLRRASRTGGTAVSRGSRGALVVTEVALSVALLCCAALLIRTMQTLARQDVGIAHADAVVVDVQLPDAEYTFARTSAFFTAVLEDVRSAPRVTSAGASNFLPLEVGWRMPFARPEVPAPPDVTTNVQFHTVDEAYFTTVGARLLSGRDFDAHDDTARAGALIINEAMARRYFAGEEPVGRRITFTSRNVGPMGVRLVGGTEHEVVGVVSDIRNASLTEPAEPAAYWPIRQFPFRKMYIIARGTASRAELAGIVREAVRRQDASLPIGEVRTLARVLAAPADPTRLVMLVMTGFAGLAMALAVTGIYGVLSYMIDLRQREIGVRLALGATAGSVLAMVVRNAAVLGAAGVAAGLLIAFAVSRLVERLLFGVAATDPLAIGAATAVVFAAVLAAAAAPALRAARTDPMTVLRE